MIDLIETERLRVQAVIDSTKAPLDRNKLGQFATPTKLALEVLRHAKTLFKPKDKIRFLDPAIGTGSFYSALLDAFGSKRIETATGFEIDRDFANAAQELWSTSGLKVIPKDFTEQTPEQVNLIICNPPYVRHHHLTSECKNRLRRKVANELGLEVSGLTGLYCYFMLLAHQWMADDAIAGWLIPSEFMDVNYGAQVKQYLLEHVELLQIHRFDPTEAQFDDALVSSAVVWFRKRKPKKNHKANFTFGGSLDKPKLERKMPITELALSPKWTRFPVGAYCAYDKDEKVLGDLFSIRRGLATGDNRFFILSKERIQELGLPMECFKPVLPPPRLLRESEVKADSHGHPVISNPSYLLDTTLTLEEIRKQYPKLADYLTAGEVNGVAKGYLCAHREPWYSQERRGPAPILCTYMGRGSKTKESPFRFILNESNAIATNVYLMLYPREEMKPEVIKAAWTALNKIPHEVLRGEGRVYGGGLHKLEPKELANVPLSL